ncbi:hypothetical protein NEIFLAOT_00702 [Neisseria flavescens NRL30031/H210]|uniref:Uncharacterized protein n=1 Tax=Neisseria flavescens NRL30031/H210 TaxID=546264 RepID=C0EL97_NEIFL|nr:hypothetical protein NEIFLAOT_00702 [Neisseria flavescens NRL30031/H210]
MRLPPCQKCRLKRWASDGIFYFTPLQQAVAHTPVNRVRG